MSQEGVGACRYADDRQVATRFELLLHGHSSGTDGFLGHEMPGAAEQSTYPFGHVLILMGDWCASDYEGDTESKEDPAASRVPHGRKRRWLKTFNHQQRRGAPT